MGIAALAITVSATFSGCGPAEEVEVLSLPDMERPSAEARLGLPEIEGSWQFAGWEVLRGDSVALDRTFPSFGGLAIDVQRLDSIAGRFALSAGLMPVSGDVRKDGTVTLVTLPGGVPTSYIAGRFDADTLWLEMTSVMAQNEWPSNSRAAFVREPVEEAIAWIRGARPTPEEPVDTSGVMMDSTGLPMGMDTVGGTPMTGGIQQGPASPSTPSSPPATSRPSVQQPNTGSARPAAPSPPPPSQPSRPPSTAPAPPPSRPSGGSTQPETVPAPDDDLDDPPAQQPEPEPEPAPSIPEPDIPDLLGDPVQ